MPPVTAEIPAYTLDPEDRNFTLRHAVNLLNSLTSVIERDADPDLHNTAEWVYAELTSLGDVFVTDRSVDTTLDTVGIVERWLQQQEDIHSAYLERHNTALRLSSEGNRVLERGARIRQKVTELKVKLLYIVDTRMCRLSTAPIRRAGRMTMGTQRLCLASWPTFEDLSARKRGLARHHERERRCLAHRLVYPQGSSVLDSREVPPEEIHDFFNIHWNTTTTPQLDRLFTLLHPSRMDGASGRGPAEFQIRSSSTVDASSTESEDLPGLGLSVNLQVPLAMASLLTVDIRQHAAAQTGATEAQHAGFLSSLRSCMLRT